MVPVLAALFAETHYLRRSGFTSDVETGEFNSGRGAGFVYNCPHRLHHSCALIRRNTEISWLRSIESAPRALGPIVSAVGIADGADRAHFFQHVRYEHFALHTDSRVRAQQCDGGQNILALSER